MKTSNPILSVENLSIAFGDQVVVHNLSFDIFPNEILGVVGESSSGKSVTALSLMGLLPHGNKHFRNSSIQFDGHDLHRFSSNDFEPIRGKQIAMIFQEPMSALNPSMCCGNQIMEVLLQHTFLSRKEARNETLRLLELVQLPDPKATFSKYPHQISGGQQQRIMIAMAIACQPKLLIADEPTTALDVTVQKEIIALLKVIQKKTQMALLFITHDLSLVADIADRLLVMHQGKLVEQGPTSEIFSAPKEPYTQGLLGARPPLKKRPLRLPTVADLAEEQKTVDFVTKDQRNNKHKIIYGQSPLLEAMALKKEYITQLGWIGKQSRYTAVDDVSFKLYPGETLGLVGESGCGKSTLAKTILQLETLEEGTILFKGIDIKTLKGKALKRFRKDVQLVFQDPFASLNPAMSVGKAIMEPMAVHKMYTSQSERKEKTMNLLEKVGLKSSHFDRFPHEFSGGQRQRINIARALALNPKIIVCDESVSALDISIQAQILNLLNDLKDQFGFSYLFISHDLSVVRYMSDRIMVMKQGEIIERGEADSVFSSPKSNYTKELLAAIPKA